MAPKRHSSAFGLQDQLPHGINLYHRKTPSSFGIPLTKMLKEIWKLKPTSQMVHLLWMPHFGFISPIFLWGGRKLLLLFPGSQAAAGAPAPARRRSRMQWWWWWWWPPCSLSFVLLLVRPSPSWQLGFKQKPGCSLWLAWLILQVLPSLFLWFTQLNWSHGKMCDFCVKGLFPISIFPAFLKKI